MNPSASAPLNSNAFRALLIVLAGLASVAILVAIRLVSAGSIHHGQDTLRAVAVLHRALPTDLREEQLPAEFRQAISALPGDYDVGGWTTQSILGVEAVCLELRRRPSGDRSTLCVWPKTGRFTSPRSSSRDVEGVRIDLWTSTNHVFALARDL